jgi:hypothetical protein
MFALGEGIEVAQERVVARPAPDQRDEARELRGLVRVAGILEVAEVDRAVRHHLVHDLAGVAVEDQRDVPQRPRVVLDRLELPDRHAREGGVLAVGREHPLVVREAGADEADAIDAPRGRRVVPPLVDVPDLEVARRLREVEDVLLAPLDPLGQQRVAGQRELRPAGHPLPGGDLGLERARRVRERGRQLRARVGQAAIGSGDGDPERARAARRQRQLIGQAAARAVAERAVVAELGRRRVAGRVAALGQVLLRRRAAIAVAGDAAHGCRVRRDERGPVVLGGVRMRPAVLGEHQRLTVGGAAVLEVEPAGVRHRPRPWVLTHQLRGGLHAEPHRALGARVRDPEPDQHRAAAVGREVGALQPEPGGVGQLHPRVAPAAREPLGPPDPVAVDREPDAVDELQRRGPYAAHLAGDVPALAVEVAVLEADDVRPLRRGDVPAVLEPVRDGQLRRGLGHAPSRRRPGPARPRPYAADALSSPP